MLFWWQKSGYEINYSHFFRGGWRGVLQWCNVRAHKRIISACTIDFRSTLTYQSTSADLRQQRLTSFCVVCGVLFGYKRESTVVSSGVRAVTLVTYICPTVNEFGFIQWNHDYFYYMFWTADFFGDQLSLTVHVHKLECLVKRLLCCIQGRGHSEGSELQRMFTRTISLIGQT